MPFTTPATAVPLAIVQTQHRNILRDNDNYFNGLVPPPAASGRVPVLISASLGTQTLLDHTSFYSGTLPISKIADGAIYNSHIGSLQIGTQHLAGTVLTSFVPLGVIMMYPSESIPTGWTRETSVNGRIPVTAGTLWTEETNYGSSWSHDHDVDTQTEQNTNSVYELGEFGSPKAVSHDHDHDIVGTTAGTVWLPPSYAYVFIRRSS